MNHEWGTPQRLFDKLNDEFHFTVDVCATPENSKCEKFYTRRETCIACGGTGVIQRGNNELGECFMCDGLLRSWEHETVWMNPPYGKEIVEWMEKAAMADATVVCLIPTRTNAPWWHDYVMRADEIRFIRKKVSFEGVKDGVAFTGHAIVVFRPIKNESMPFVSSYDQPSKGKA